jgi:hypothetical protein
MKNCWLNNPVSTKSGEDSGETNQRWGFIGLFALGGTREEPAGTTTCFGFLGFFASLFPRNWPLAMVVLLAKVSSNIGWARKGKPDTSQS